MENLEIEIYVDLDVNIKSNAINKFGPCVYFASNKLDEDALFTSYTINQIREQIKNENKSDIKTTRIKFGQEFNTYFSLIQERYDLTKREAVMLIIACSEKHLKVCGL